MNKKLIFLILCLPLLLMLSLYSVSKTVRLAVGVPVSKIEIIGDQIVYMDIDKTDKYVIDYVIYPTSAKNQNVTFSAEPVGNAPLADIEFVDGSLVANSCGKAKVIITTADGGFRDSFIIEISSNSIKSISSTLENDLIYVGKTSKISTTFTPADTIYTRLNYNSSNPNIASVSADGTITGISKGQTTITISSTIDPSIFDTVTVEVKNEDIIDLISDNVVTWASFGQIDIATDLEEPCTFSYTAVDKDNNEISPSAISFEFDYSKQAQNQVSLKYTFNDPNIVEDITVKIKVVTESGYELEKICTISHIKEITAKFVDTSSVGINVGYSTIIPFTVTPKDSAVEYSISTTNNNIIVSVNEQNKFIELSAIKLGKTTITLKIANLENPDEFVTITKDVVVFPTTIYINESSKTYGIENTFAVGKTEVDGSLSEFEFSTSYGNALIGENFLENVNYVASSSNVEISKEGTLTLKAENGSETVSIKSVFECDGYRKESEPFEILCVYDGLNVRNYLDLYNATNSPSPKPIVLQNNIKEDFAVGVGNNYYKEIYTTYDSTYYKNMGKEETAKVKILIEFKADVYGNGYSINAHNVAWKKNLQNAGQNSVFSGPLNFVALSETGGMIQVKAQDNICFAVYENVTISNIELKGCDLTADEENNIDLTDLTYTGTTVEVLGDNVDIKYSRISNGRTVLRAFGDIENPEKVINLKIENCVLGGAREFIVRLGSNCFVDGTLSNPAPNLPNNTLNSFPAQKHYTNMTEQEKLEYEQKFIKTYVTIKNTIFENAGIFAIGLDAHFAGPALADGSAFLDGLTSGWKDLAKTSYGVKLTFEEEVKLYNWKDLNEVDSSTLIEVLGSTAFGDIQLNISDMINALHNSPEFENVIYESNNVKYIHAGIAFFGGGKNYSVFDDKNYTTYDLNEYAINLSDVGKGMLSAAAGYEDFYFMLCDRTTLDFLPETQEEILESGNAYSCIYK